ncbi:MFS transporter [Citricoccus nitrophenolicus]|uniref:CP family cyanate transporter-like MFS transporter n=1 Tax=Citricoccus muralis TaxID=169134 RepID=A0A3D9LB20_9MICC|nr:MFS transporter [Citricoccus muralis]REE03579.1 CP family cyanate transporter-like MFS transporter [Citricoccus muralis]
MTTDPGANSGTNPGASPDITAAPTPGVPTPGVPSVPPAGRAGRAGRGTIGITLAVLAVVFIAVNLRPGATALGPVLAEVSASLQINGTVAGVITALPGLMFGLVGFVAVSLGRRAGLSLTIALSLIVMVLGLLLRPFAPSIWVFIPFTALALAGMAVGNVLVPAWIKRHGGGRTVALMTLYSMFLTVGGSAGSGLASPLAEAAGTTLSAGDPTEGWRWSLGFWGLAAVVPLVLWLLVARRTGHDFPGTPPQDEPDRPLRSSPTAVFLMVLFGVQSMNAYVQFGWLPQMYRDAGLDANLAGALLSVVAALGVVGGLVMPTVIDRSRTLAPWMIGFGIATAGGWAGMLLAPAAGGLWWAVLLGLGGFAFPTAIALIPARSRQPHVTARLSGFVQPYGYIVAAVGPMTVGLIHAATGNWTLVLILLACSGLVMALAGLRVSARVYVDDEITVQRG